MMSTEKQGTVITCKVLEKSEELSIKLYKELHSMLGGKKKKCL